MKIIYILSHLLPNQRKHLSSLCVETHTYTQAHTHTCTHIHAHAHSEVTLQLSLFRGNCGYCSLLLFACLYFSSFYYANYCFIK